MFKENFLKMRTRSALRKNKSLRSSIPYKQSLSIGLIFSDEGLQKYTDIKNFIQQLEQDGKQVKVIEFLAEKKEDKTFEFDHFTKEDLSFWGMIRSEQADRFSETSFDFLFYLDTISNPLTLNLLARSKAQCRVGKFTEEESPYFEMMIEQSGTVKGLIETMYKYTKQLR